MAELQRDGLPGFERVLEFDRGLIDEEARTVDVVVSTETPVNRYFGDEILDHSPGAVDLERFNDSAAVLVNHDRDAHIGVVVPGSARVGKRKMTARLRFSESERGQEIFNDIKAGIRTKMSVGYRINSLVLQEATEDKEVFRVTEWEPHEVSVVSIPADTNAQVGRSMELEKRNNVNIQLSDEMKRKFEMLRDKEPEGGGGGKTVEIDVEAIRKEEREKTERETRELMAREIEERKGKDKEIRALAAPHGEHFERLAEDAIEKCAEVGDFAKELAKEIGKRHAQPIGAPANRGLSRKEEKDIANFRFCGDGSDGGARGFLFEVWEGGALTGLNRELAQEGSNLLRSQGVANSGNVIPQFALTRDMTTGAGTGGELIETELRPPIEILRERLMVRALGARFVTGLQGNVDYPTITRGSAPTEKAENAAADEYSFTTGSKSLTPNRLPVTADLSLQWIIQSSVDAEMETRNLLAFEIASRMDAMAINGSGASNQPTGILNTSGIGAVAIGTNGGAPTRDHIINLETEIATDNADVASLNYLTTPGVRGKLKQTATDAGSGLFVWGETAAAMNGYGASVSTNVPSTLTKGTGTNLHAILFGNFADMIVGQWGGFDIVIDAATKATTGLRVITINTFYDVLVRHAESFAAVTDADIS